LRRAGTATGRIGPRWPASGSRRKDTALQEIQSRVANSVRNAILHDGTRDTGCGLKAFPARIVPVDALFQTGCIASVPALVRRGGF